MDTAGNSFQGEFVDVNPERTMGLVGSILAIASTVPHIGGILSMLGFVLVLIALHGIGEKLGDDRPFKYYLYSLLILIATVFFVILFAVLLEGGGLGALILILPIGLVGFLSGLYYRKEAWTMMARITGVKEFEEAAKFLWWGGLTIIILIGLVLLLVSWIYQILGFARMPNKLKRGILTRSFLLGSEPLSE